MIRYKDVKSFDFDAYDGRPAPLHIGDHLDHFPQFIPEGCGKMEIIYDWIYRELPCILAAQKRRWLARKMGSVLPPQTQCLKASVNGVDTVSLLSRKTVDRFYYMPYQLRRALKSFDVRERHYQYLTGRSDL